MSIGTSAAYLKAWCAVSIENLLLDEPTRGLWGFDLHDSVDNNFKRVRFLPYFKFFSSFLFVSIDWFEIYSGVLYLRSDDDLLNCRTPLSNLM